MRILALLLGWICGALIIHMVQAQAQAPGYPGGNTIPYLVPCASGEKDCYVPLASAPARDLLSINRNGTVTLLRGLTKDECDRIVGITQSYYSIQVTACVAP